MLTAALLVPLVWPAHPLQAAPTAAIQEHAAVVRRILVEAASRGTADLLLSELCTRAPKRLAGSPGAEEALRWASEKMRALGLEEVRLEPCSVPRWERGETARLVIEEPKALAGASLAILALGGSAGTPAEGIDAPLLVVHSLAELEQRASEAKGKIVLFNRPFDPAVLDPFEAYGGAVDQRSEGPARAARAGAVAALVRSVTPRLDDVPHTGATRFEAGTPALPAAAVSTRAAETLAELARPGATVRLRLWLDCRTLEDVPSWNVVGELHGREHPEQFVLLGAHLDAWDVGQGAHDDGAGCVQALEAVRLLRALDLRPRRTLRVVLFMNEENGLRGALAYRDAHLQELGQHVLAVESDRGGFAPRGFSSAAQGETRATLAAIAALLEPIGAGALFFGGGGADVQPLEAHGVLTAGLVPEAARYFDVHHSEHDVLAAVHPRELNLGAGALAAFAYVAAELLELRSTPATR
jgi:hypothetical protein